MSATQDLLTAIVSACNSHAVFVSAGLSITLTQAPETATLPWMLFAILPGTRIERAFDKSSTQSYMIQFTVVSGSALQAVQLADELLTLFDCQTFTTGGPETVVQAYLSRPPTCRQVQRSSAGQPVFTAMAIYRFDLFVP